MYFIVHSYRRCFIHKHKHKHMGSLLFKTAQNLYILKANTKDKVIYGCSECLSIAIQSNRRDLLRSLLEQPNIAYRDIFWVEKPIESVGPFDGDLVSFDGAPPALHNIDNNSDLSFVGKKDCGHKQLDVELLNPLGEYTGGPILVSLPMLAQWYSTEQFPAEQMMRDSGKFDFTEPQLFHLHLSANYHDDSKLIVIAFSYAKRIFGPSFGNSSTDRMSSFLFGDGTKVWGRFSKYSKCINSEVLEVHQNYYQLPQLLLRAVAYDDSNDDLFIPELLRIIEAGADLNHYFTWHFEINWWSRYSRVFAARGLMSYLCIFCRRSSFAKDEDRFAIQFLFFSKFLSLLLRHGVSFFLGERNVNSLQVKFRLSFYMLLRYAPSSTNPEQLDFENASFLDRLFYACGVRRREFCRGIAWQFLALGYGRRELHPDGVPLFDEHLDCTREAHNSDPDDYCAAELQALVDRFDSGPLSLLQLARIAVRRAVGGKYFVRQMSELVSSLPRSLFEYVADPTELMQPANAPSSQA